MIPARFIGFLALALLLTACASPLDVLPSPTHTPPPTASPTSTPAATHTKPPPSPIPSDTPTPPPTATPTATPGPTQDDAARDRRARLPILMYHYVEPWPADAGSLRQGLTVKPDDFAAQMQYLHDRGYVSVSLYDLMDALARGSQLPPQAVVITFDDGYRDLVEHAVPVMQGYGYTGTVFVITDFMDRELEPYLTWPQAESLYAQGWKIEPHTKTHENLQGGDRDMQLYQMLGAVQTIQAHIGAMPRFFNYPYGKYDALTVQLDREIGLWGGVTVGFGRLHSLDTIYTLTRVRVDGRGSLQDFVRGLESDLP